MTPSEVADIILEPGSVYEQIATRMVADGGWPRESAHGAFADFVCDFADLLDHDLDAITEATALVVERVYGA
jgi:hypothetical protein